MPEKQTYDPSIQAPGKDIPGQGRQEGQPSQQQQQKEEDQPGQRQGRQGEELGGQQR